MRRKFFGTLVLLVEQNLSPVSCILAAVRQFMYFAFWPVKNIWHEPDCYQAQ